MPPLYDFKHPRIPHNKREGANLNKIQSTQRAQWTPDMFSKEPIKG
jgi:hypothetical protein